MSRTDGHFSVDLEVLALLAIITNSVLLNNDKSKCSNVIVRLLLINNDHVQCRTDVLLRNGTGLKLNTTVPILECSLVCIVSIM